MRSKRIVLNDPDKQDLSCLRKIKTKADYIQIAGKSVHLNLSEAQMDSRKEGNNLQFHYHQVNFSFHPNQMNLQPELTLKGETNYFIHSEHFKVEDTRDNLLPPKIIKLDGNQLKVDINDNACYSIHNHKPRKICELYKELEKNFPKKLKLKESKVVEQLKLIPLGDSIRIDKADERKV